MRKIVIPFCFVLLIVIMIFSGCTNTQESGTPATPKTEYVTNLVTQTPSQQIVYATVIVPVTVPITNKDTAYKGVEQDTENIQMIGNVYGIASIPSPSAGIDQITFMIGLVPNSSPIYLINTKIVFSTESTTPKILTWDTKASKDTFTSKLNGLKSVTILNASGPVQVTFNTEQVPAETKITIELIPESGASYSFSKTTPSTILAKNVLY